MVVCKFCRKEMLDGKGCLGVPFKYKDGLAIEPIKYGFHEHDTYPEERCHDCACEMGHYHHPGCDNEICPRCDRQAISCDCELEGEHEN